MATTSVPHRWTYNVFVSFRGEDIRKSFMDHLYKDFRQKGIHAFRDDNELPRGEEISPQLYKAIEESRFLIVIFSKNYASSSWCLKELVKILECKQIGKHEYHVRIIFYDVKPAVVRNQTESYAEAFAKHESSNKTDVAKWKEALSMAANLSGWDLQDKANGYESKFIDSISKEILENLCHGPLHVGENLVGMDARLNKMNLLHFVGSNKVHMIGICGIGGIGKTTLAKAIYNLMYIHFEECSFLDDVQGATKRHGLTHVVMHLIDDIMKTSDVKISNIGQGIMVIKQRMASRRILLVLDGVDHHEQLEALAGSCNWFFPGSLIIFTSKDKQLLSPKVDEIYNMEFLDDAEALELFSLNAFHKKHPTKDFKELAEQVVEYVQGHPFALEVLGCFSYGKTVHEWKSELDKLKTYPNAKIQQVLRLSFDGLDFDQKRIFLDIACYLIGENKDFAVSVLDGCSFFADTSIRVLVDKSLITISSTKSLQMHDLIQRMAREIVREESNWPGNRSRLWIPSEVYDVLTENKAAEAVEVLVLLQEESRQKVHIDGKAFAHMKNLRILKICYPELENFWQPTLKLPKDYKVNFFGRLEFLSNKLRLLYWHGCPFKFLPSDFYPENIVDIDLSYSHIKNLWTIPKCFIRLKVMKLKHCRNLTSTPNFTEITNLEELILEGCVNLVKVHPSIGMLKRLIVLNLKNCKRLRSLPCKIEMDSLEILILSGCPLEVFGTVNPLVEVPVDQTAITEFPYFVFSLTNLQVISVGIRRWIESRWWTSILWPSYLQRQLQKPPSLVLPSLASLRLLRYLNVRDCNISEVSPDIGGLSCLQNLNLGGNNFTCLPASLSQLFRLKFLKLNDCKKLEVLPELPRGIYNVDTDGCTSLRGPGNIQVMLDHSCPTLSLMGCPKVVENLTSLMSTWLPQGLRLDAMFYQNTIPQWFPNQSTGNCVKVELPPGWSYNKFRGYETYVVFTPKEPSDNGQQGYCERTHYSRVNQDMEGYCVHNFNGHYLDHAYWPRRYFGCMVAAITREMIHASCKTWLHYSKSKPIWKKAENFVTFSFRGSPSIEVKECGARLVCDEDIQEETSLSMFPGLPTPTQDDGVFHLSHKWSSGTIVDEYPNRNRLVMWCLN